jgi:hypothetical protein
MGDDVRTEARRGGHQRQDVGEQVVPSLRVGGRGDWGTKVLAGREPVHGLGVIEQQEPVPLVGEKDRSDVSFARAAPPDEENLGEVTPPLFLYPGDALPDVRRYAKTVGPEIEAHAVKHGRCQPERSSQNEVVSVWLRFTRSPPGVA